MTAISKNITNNENSPEDNDYGFIIIVSNTNNLKADCVQNNVTTCH